MELPDKEPVPVMLSPPAPLSVRSPVAVRDPALDSDALLTVTAAVPDTLVDAPVMVTEPVAPEAVVDILRAPPWKACEDAKLMLALLAALAVTLIAPAPV